MKLQRHFTGYCLELCQNFKIDHCVFIYFLRNPFLGNFATLASSTGNTSSRRMDLKEVSTAAALFLGVHHVNYFNLKPSDPLNRYLTKTFHLEANTMMTLPVGFRGIQIGTLIAALEYDRFLPIDGELNRFKQISDGMTVHMQDMLKSEEESAYTRLKFELKKIWRERGTNNNIPAELLIKALSVVVDVRKLYLEVNINEVCYWHLSEVDECGDLLFATTQSVPVQIKRLSDGDEYEKCGFNINIPVIVNGDHIGNIRISTLIGVNIYMDNVKRVLVRASREIVRFLPEENYRII